MKNMSFALTTAQFKAETKDVTRRLGWLNLKPGELVMGVVKCMGLKPGEKIEKLGVIEIVSVTREILRSIDQADCEREGFPEMTPDQFVAMFCKHMDCGPDDLVTRIEFKHRRDIRLNREQAGAVQGVLTLE